MSTESPDPCKFCKGSGTDHKWRTRCSFCSGSGLRIQPKFRAECECGAKQPRLATGHTVDQWMHKHLEAHRPGDV